MWVFRRYDDKWQVGYWDQGEWYSPAEYIFDELSQAEAKVHYLNG